MPDDEEAAALGNGDDAGLLDYLRRLDPVPPVPLQSPHEVGLGAVLRGLAGRPGSNLLADDRARRVLDLVGDRLSIAAGPDGLTVRGMARRRSVPWDRVDRLVFEGRYEMLRGRAVTRITRDVGKRLLRVPVPGLPWLMGRVVGGLSGWIEDKTISSERAAQLRQDAGWVLTHVECRGSDIEMSGPLLLVSLLAPGLSEAVEQEARRRGVQVELGDE
ncbi:MAG: PH domain-containing protein [Acidimicrobiia bacterium]